MQKAEILRLLVRQLHPIGPRRFEQTVCAEHIGADEGIGAIDRAVNMALRGQVHDDVGRVRVKHGIHRGTVANIGLDEAVAWTIGDCLQRAQIRRVR